MEEGAGPAIVQDRTALRGLEERLFKLVSKGATQAQWAEWLRVPLEHAATEGDNDLVMSLLQAGANSSAGWKGCNGRTLLEAATEGGNHEVVSNILEAGGLGEMDVGSSGESMTVLHRAIASEHMTAAGVLVLGGTDVRSVDSNRRSALHYAIEGGHLQLARHILIAGADVDAADCDGDTPLHLVR